MSALLLAGLAVPPGLAAQAPPPGGIAEVERDYGLGFGVATLGWDEASVPFDDVAMGTLSLERDLWRGVSGRAAVAWGGTTLTADEPVDAGVWSLDLQVLLAPEFGPLANLPVTPYAVGGLGALVTNPRGDLPTRSQSQWSYGAGIRGALAERWGVMAEGTAVGVRFADPLVPENRETRTIHNIRWEGRLQWRF
ncbi:MAG: porin family protein [Gemmatimonadetes bacterium]|nr:porin family protein [Gemmatimonadota bacterium]